MSSFKCKLVLFENHWPHKKIQKNLQPFGCVLYLQPNGFFLFKIMSNHE